MICLRPRTVLLNLDPQKKVGKISKTQPIFAKLEAVYGHIGARRAPPPIVAASQRGGVLSRSTSTSCLIPPPPPPPPPFPGQGITVQSDTFRLSTVDAVDFANRVADLLIPRLLPLIRSLVMAHYENFPLGYEYHTFAAMGTIQGAMSVVRSIPFTVHSERERARQTILGIVQNAIVVPNSRFPRDGYYIDMTTGSIADMFDKILAALDFSETSLEQSASHVRENHRSQANDAKLSWLKGCQFIMTTLSRPTNPSAPINGIFCRASFEMFFNTRWVGEIAPSGSIPIRQAQVSSIVNPQQNREES